jgi:hypothetical protein
MASSTGPHGPQEKMSDMRTSTSLATFVWNARNMSDLNNLSRIAGDEYRAAVAQFGMFSPQSEYAWELWGKRAKWESAYLRMVYPWSTD